MMGNNEKLVRSTWQFLAMHQAALWLLVSELGNRNAQAALNDLEAEFEKSRPDPSFVMDLLETLQEFLLEPPTAAFTGFRNLSDLDAATRWHVARLSDLLSLVRA